MKTEIKHRKYIDKREKLENVIPLETPFSIYIEPTDKCNFKCKFCPTGNIELMKNTEGRNYGNMSITLFKKIVDDISYFKNKIKILHLYQHGEPLLNKDFEKMVECAKKINKFNIISTTTNAYLLTEDRSIGIIDAGLDRIHISIEAMSSSGYFDLTKTKIDFDKLVKNIDFFYKNRKQCKVFIKIFNNNLLENEAKKFFDIFGNISDYIFIENIVSHWGEFDVSSDVNPNTNISHIGEKIVKKKVCPLPFYSIGINSNGTVSPCCGDWARKIIIGNVNNENIIDIWNSEKLKKLQLLFLTGNRNKHIFCSSCQMPEYGVSDNIDDYSEEILYRITRPDQTRPDQTRPDQTRPDQTRPNIIICSDYIYLYNNTKYKKTQPMLQYNIAA